MASVKTRKGNVSEDLKVLRYLTPVLTSSKLLTLGIAKQA